MPGAGSLIWNWHLDILCSELQTVAERVFRNEPKQYDVIFNISPGTSKSTICSILFPAWVWTRFPQGRIISASHTETLVLDLAAKARYVIQEDKYQYYWPHIQLREDQASKGYYANTLGGDRLTCTVAGKSPTGFHAHFLVVDDPIDPKKAVSALELKTAADFMTTVLPSRKVDKAVSVTFLIMQRLHQDDPTGILIKKSKHEETGQVKHYCLPGEIYNDWEVSPGELKHYYVNDLMDPVRLPRAVLRDFEVTLGAYGYAGQFGQSPIPLGGGMFKPQWFNQRIKAAPYEASRIRYIDRASTKDGGCRTAMVLMARGGEGNYYVEHVELGQWEPDDRNERIKACCLRDRCRYGPWPEPAVYVEAEGGSSRRDAWKAIARILAGFTIREDKVTGKKDTRAEPWACQLAAGNVFIVDDGSWDIQAYIDEHINFRPSEDGPLGRWKDQVDASSGAFNLLTGSPRIKLLQTFHLGRSQSNPLRIIIGSWEDLVHLHSEQRSVLVVIADPERKEDSCPEPVHNRVREGVGDQNGSLAQPLLSENDHANGQQQGLPVPGAIDQLHLTFADIQPCEYQEQWAEQGSWAGKVCFQPEQGKQLWRFLLKQRPLSHQLIFIQEENGRRALSLAYALCDVWRLPRQQTIYQPAQPDWHGSATDQLPNKYLYDQVIHSRGLVV